MVSLAEDKDWGEQEETAILVLPKYTQIHLPTYTPEAHNERIYFD